MVEGAPERRLTVIVAIDVAGYSRLMGNDEEGKLAALNAHPDTMMPMMADHGGPWRAVGEPGGRRSFVGIFQCRPGSQMRHGNAGSHGRAQRPYPRREKDGLPHWY